MAPTTDAPKVFTTFACGGGSSMGYKLAGFDVVGANDIDPKMASVYKDNLDPKYFFETPIGELVDLVQAGDFPDELLGIDILDGSPPCSTFSLSGNREKDWGVDKVFREGQAKQILSDLFFDYLELVRVIQPKVFVAENVAAMLFGNAKGYVRQIVRTAKEYGYCVQVFKLNASSFGIPQSRTRIFFVGRRMDRAMGSLVIRAPKQITKLTLRDAFRGLVQSQESLDTCMLNPSTQKYKHWHAAKRGEQFLKTRKRLGLSYSHFNMYRCSWNRESPCLTTSPVLFHPDEPRCFTDKELYRISSFPDDYKSTKLKGNKGKTIAQYLTGMSVPPRLMEFIASAIGRQWFDMTGDHNGKH